MQSVTLKGNENFLNEALQVIKALADKQNEPLEIKSNQTENSLSELKADYKNRVDEVINGTVKLYSIDELTKECEQW
ncbi:hypothetical protein [Campylobacter fetus]|uniref:hypothetical protein n=1 Tax=Campylobacter fetus TaxID=196 RepID=UPI000818BA0D|nr:hypothetical protein [Campylobacter fetus]OCR87488.1 hypothetical protein CFT12S00416_08205 [Campylobacter fetus subsp. testudinum]OCR92481.1 hypothetical protein CFT12S02263_05585 [Campylobacter fetus subsp. testudinum]OCR97374.1 hypothetical protein CFT12S02855_07260 [Campylobacter fetus subsp. testudinum]OCR98970.1 hypothetical protein A9K75_09125 [Campylobacter fetus subsp. testudinum]OCS03365.1 hypothetical protein AC237_07820 [Campylobacter fetus subsp. testudinum]